ncbi:MAG: ATP-dependent Clp protease adapter ClpS [Verrucomicrobiota bacterium]
MQRPVFWHGSSSGGGVATGASPEVTPDVDVEEKVEEAFDKGWQVVVWDDPVNLMSYVVFVFKKVLGMNESEATKHMLEVHEKGKSAVAKDNKERAEFLVHRFHGFGLNATMEQAE